MGHTRRTLALSEDWDLSATESGGIATLEGAAATAQAVANEARLFEKDAYFAQDRGIPYWIAALGGPAGEAALEARLRKAALLVDDVAEVESVELDGFDAATRTFSGEIRVTTVESETGTVSL